MLTYGDLISEVKRRAIRDQSGTTFDTAVKNIINTSLFRISREAPWRVMRRKSYFDTVTSYTKGSGAATATTSSVNVTLTGATLITDDVHIDRSIKLSGDGDYFDIRSITGETTLTIDRLWGASTTTNMTYEIFPQCEYNLPIQAGHRMFIWHEDYGYPYQLDYVTDQEFVNDGYDRWEKGTPTTYMMWGEDMVKQQPKQAGRLTVFSTSANDTNQTVTIFGTVGGYPAFENITLNGATAVTGGSLFSAVERITKNATSAGRIGVFADANTSTVVAIMPMGDTTAGVMYRKIKLYPLPTRVFPINVQYYKDPYRLVNDGDVHELGQEFDEAIILLSVAKIKAENSQNEAGGFFNMYVDEIRTLKKINCDKIDWFPTLLRPKATVRDTSVRPNLLYRQVGSEFGRRSR
jgi:hypothetical protein